MSPLRGRSSEAEHQLPKLRTRVRFPSPALSAMRATSPERRRTCRQPVMATPPTSALRRRVLITPAGEIGDPPGDRSQLFLSTGLDGRERTGVGQGRRPCRSPRHGRSPPRAVRCPNPGPGEPRRRPGPESTGTTSSAEPWMSRSGTDGAGTSGGAVPRKGEWSNPPESPTKAAGRQPPRSVVSRTTSKPAFAPSDHPARTTRSRPVPALRSRTKASEAVRWCFPSPPSFPFQSGTTVGTPAAAIR